MGQYASSDKEIPKRTIDLDVDIWCECFGFGSRDEFAACLESSRFSSLSDDAHTLRPADLVNRARLACIELSVEDALDTISINRPSRPVSKARVSALEKSMFEGGIFFDDYHHFAVSLELPHNMPKVMNLVLLDGYHRLYAFLDLCRAHHNRTRHEWDTSTTWVESTFDGKERKLKNLLPRNARLSIDILYLGPDSRGLYVNASMALNLGNGHSHPMNFLDILVGYLDLRNAGKSKHDVIQNCSSFFPGKTLATRRLYIGVMERMVQSQTLLDLLGNYYSEAVESSSEQSFFTISRLHKQLPPLRSLIGPMAELFYVLWVLRHQPLYEGHKLRPEMSVEHWAAIRACAEALGQARQAMTKALEGMASRKEKVLLKKPKYIGAIVDLAVKYILEHNWEDVVDKDGSPRHDAHESIMPDLLSKAIFQAAKKHAEREGRSEVVLDECECQSLFSGSLPSGTVEKVEKCGRTDSGVQQGPRDVGIVGAHHDLDTDAGCGTLSGVATSSGSSLGGQVSLIPPHPQGKYAATGVFVAREGTLADITAGLRHNKNHNDVLSKMISVLVWHVGCSGSTDDLRNVLEGLITDGYFSEGRVILFEDVRTTDGHQGPEAATSVRTNHHADVQTAAKVVEDALQRPGHPPPSRTVYDIRVGDEHLKSIPRKVEDKICRVVVSPSSIPADVYCATVLQRRPITVQLLHGLDPSLDHDGWPTLNLLTGPRLCRADKAETPRTAYRAHMEWDEYLSSVAQDKHGPRRSGQPSVETFVAILLRTGAAVAKEGQAVVTHDPFGSWAEACVEIGIPCVTHVGPHPPRCVEEAVQRMGMPEAKHWQ